MSTKEECLHTDITDEGVCTGCGLDVNSDEFYDALPPIPEPLELGDIMGIIRLATKTAEEYVELIKKNADPNHPEKPRLRLVAGMVMRLPDTAFWSTVLIPSFKTAKSLGYRGDYDKWETICKKFVDK